MVSVAEVVYDFRKARLTCASGSADAVDGNGKTVLTQIMAAIDNLVCSARSAHARAHTHHARILMQPRSHYALRHICSIGVGGRVLHGCQCPRLHYQYAYQHYQCPYQHNDGQVGECRTMLLDRLKSAVDDDAAIERYFKYSESSTSTPGSEALEYLKSHLIRGAEQHCSALRGQSVHPVST